MALHNTRGKEGETMAAGYLGLLDYEVLYCNWRRGHYEVDIIAAKDEVLHFIEVKTRHSLSFGHPEEGVSKKKLGNLKKAAACFVSEQRFNGRIQFDILSITRLKGQPAQWLLMEDVYI